MIDCDSHLRTGVLAVVLVIAGCIGAPGGTPTTDPGTPGGTPVTGTPTAGTPATGDPIAGYETDVFDHADVGSPAVDGGISSPTGEDGRQRNYATLIADASDADRLDRTVLDGEARAFVANTSFASSYLVVIQEAPASSVPDYRIERVVRDGDGLRVSIDDSGGYGTDDVTVETVLVRVPRGDAGVPDRVVVATEEGYTFDSTNGVVVRNRSTDTG